MPSIHCLREPSAIPYHPAGFSFGNGPQTWSVAIHFSGSLDLTCKIIDLFLGY